jgi:hypothetical protein
MRDAKRTIPESVLALFADPTRAAAIMGDLEELSVTRGRLWFWTEYVRTLIVLGWRTSGSAFLLAFAGLKIVLGQVIRWLIDHRTPSLMDAGLFGENNAHVRIICWNLSLMTAQFLCFVTPFVLIRFGPRDRLTRFACVLFILSLPIYTMRPWVMDLSGILVLLLLAATFLPAFAIRATYLFLLPIRNYPHVFRMSASEAFASDAISFAVAAILCIRLHRLLLPNPSTPGVNPPHGKTRGACA